VRAASLFWPLLAADLGLLLVFDLAHHLGVALALQGAALLGLLLAARPEASPARSGNALRVLFWNGKVAPGPLRDGIRRSLSQKTVSPPLSLAAFSIYP